MEPEDSLPHLQVPATCPYHEPFWTKLNMIRFYGEELLALRPIPKLEDHPLYVVRDCLFNLFAATLHPQLEDAPYRGDRDPLITDKKKTST